MAVNATAVWRLRPSGSDTNGGGYDPGISGAATDYSKQNAAQTTGTTGTSTVSTTFTDAGGAFTSAMIGNALWLASATGSPTVGAYFITAVGSATSVTLDRASGTYTAAHYAVGGAWATFANLGVGSGNATVDGNIVNVLGSGTPNPAAYTYDYDQTSAVTLVASITIQNDSATPGYKAPPDTTGGMPVIKFDVADHMFKSGVQNNITHQGLWFVGTTTAAGKYAVYNNCSSGAANGKGATIVFGCVLDQFSFDLGLLLTSTSTSFVSVGLGSECFTSVAPGGPGTSAAFYAQNMQLIIDGCNIHDTVGIGVYSSSGGGPISILSSIVAKCMSDGIQENGFQQYIVKNCTIDGNLGHGINISLSSQNSNCGNINNNIISNQTQAGKYGIRNQTSAGAGTQGFIDYNVYYNNTSNLLNLTQGPHDTTGGSNPFVGQSTENYTLA